VQYLSVALCHQPGLAQQRVRCNTCQWRCVINPGKLGVCRMYQNQGGTLYNLNYASVSSLAADPIEKKPLFHFFPGSLALSLGSWGCNFHCQDCQNWEISCLETDKSGPARGSGGNGKKPPLRRYRLDI